jgi:hypothetical protein
MILKKSIFLVNIFLKLSIMQIKLKVRIISNKKSELIILISPWLDLNKPNK